jgi:hypothetical protein
MTDINVRQLPDGEELILAESQPRSPNPEGDPRESLVKRRLLAQSDERGSGSAWAWPLLPLPGSTTRSL